MVESYTFYQRVWIQQELNRRMRIMKIKKESKCKNKKEPNKTILRVQLGTAWRRKRDLNPRYGFPYYSLSRGAPSASWVFLHIGQVR